MTETHAPDATANGVAETPPAPPVALPDDQNPAIIDARKTFVLTVIGSVLFVGSILLFIL